GNFVKFCILREESNRAFLRRRIDEIGHSDRPFLSKHLDRGAIDHKIQIIGPARNKRRCRSCREICTWTDSRLRTIYVKLLLTRVETNFGPVILVGVESNTEYGCRWMSKLQLQLVWNPHGVFFVGVRQIRGHSRNRKCLGAKGSDDRFLFQSKSCLIFEK